VTRLATAATLLAVLVFGATSPAAASGLIRVALVDNARAVELRGTDIEITELGPCPRCQLMARRVPVVRVVVAADGVEIDGARAGGFRLRSDLPIRFNGREYTPPLEVLKNGEGLAVVNELPLEEYLVGVLRAEAGEKWPLEALRAQAIVARTYAAYHRSIAGARPYHIVASTANQQYAGRVPLFHQDLYRLSGAEEGCSGPPLGIRAVVSDRLARRRLGSGAAQALQQPAGLVGHRPHLLVPALSAHWPTAPRHARTGPAAHRGPQQHRARCTAAAPRAG